jgi:prolyl-tRNA synthetase
VADLVRGIAHAAASALIYHIQTKWRDDPARAGLIRVREFTAKDGWSGSDWQDE